LKSLLEAICSNNSLFSIISIAHGVWIIPMTILMWYQRGKSLKVKNNTSYVLLSKKYFYIIKSMKILKANYPYYLHGNY